MDDKLHQGVRQPLQVDGDPPFKNDAFKEQWNALSPMQIRKMDVLNGPELLDVLRAIADGADPDQAIDSKVVQKLSPLFDRSTMPTNGHQRQQPREN